MPPFDNDGPLSVSDAADAFLKQLYPDGEPKDAENPPSETPKARREDKAPSEGADEKSEDQDDREDDQDDADPEHDEDTDTDDEETEETQESTKGKDKATAETAPKVASDDLEIEYTVDGKVHRASVADLKRLAGQEQALTRKSMEVAEARKATDETKVKYAASLDKVVEQARAAFEPYSKIDYLVAQGRMSPEDFAQLRRDAQQAHDTLKFLEGEVDTFVKTQEAETQKALKAQAAETWKTLSDPEKGIPGWNTTVYDEVRAFGIREGLDQQIVNNLVDPAAVKLIWKAMRYDAVQNAAKEKVVRKVNAPVRNLKPASSKTEAPTSTKQNDAMRRLRQSGSLEDAADLFMARSRRDD